MSRAGTLAGASDTGRRLLCAAHTWPRAAGGRGCLLFIPHVLCEGTRKGHGHMCLLLRENRYFPYFERSRRESRAGHVPSRLPQSPGERWRPPATVQETPPRAHARQHISEGQEPPQGACVLQGVSGLKSGVKANTCEFPARETEQGRHCRGPSCVRVLKRKQKGLSTAPEPEDARTFSRCVADRLFSSKMLRISGRGRTAGRQGPGSTWPRPEETAESTDVGGKTLVSQIGVSRSSGWGHKPHGQPGRGGRARVSGCNWTSHSCPGPLGPLSGSVEAAL